MKIKNIGPEREEKNFIVEAAEYWRNCVIGEKVKTDDGSSDTHRDSKKYYKKSKVILGTVVGALAAVATGAGAAVGISKLKGKKDEEDLYLEMSDIDEIPTIESGETPTEETTVE